MEIDKPDVYRGSPNESCFVYEEFDYIIIKRVDRENETMRFSFDEARKIMHGMNELLKEMI
jgi:hypothetical protein